MRKPNNYYEAEEVMSNIDYSIDREVEKELLNEDCYAQYSAYNFCGYVWHQDDKFYCEVWRYNSYVETFEGDTLEEIKEDVSSEYGYE